MTGSWHSLRITRSRSNSLHASMNEAGLGQGDLDKIKVVGADLNDYLHKFKPNELMIEPYGLH